VSEYLDFARGLLNEDEDGDPDEELKGGMLILSVMIGELESRRSGEEGSLMLRGRLSWGCRDEDCATEK
jgi:hypothetical protein